MIQPKYNPKEALEKIKLSMKYDTSKTLNENKGLNEQRSSCPNSLDYTDLSELAMEAANTMKKMDYMFFRMGYGKERAENLYNIVKQIKGKKVYKDTSNECLDAMPEFEILTKDASEGWWWSDKFNMQTKIRELINGYYKNEAEPKRYLKATLDLLQGSEGGSGTSGTSGGGTSGTSGGGGTSGTSGGGGTSGTSGGGGTSGTSGGGTSGTSGGGGTSGTSGGGGTSGTSIIRSKYKFCSGTYKIYCYSEVIARVQGCLGGLVQDGKFGPKTQARLQDKFPQFVNSFEDSDVAIICGGSQEIEVSDEESVDDVNSANY